MCMDTDRLHLTRREFIASGLAAAASTLLLPRPVGAALTENAPAVQIGADHAVIPRANWGGDLAPTGSLIPEAAGDVRFLLVHHSATPNGYTRDRAIEYLRSFYRYHTSPTKGWADIAYNFLVDAHGRIFEGRAGSIDAPIRGDATGGSQGFALLCCFIGDHATEPLTPRAVEAMATLLAWLASKYGIDPSPRARAEFVSRGSSLHPPGSEVTTRTITGHRTMSRTTCPGDAANAIVERELPEMVTALIDDTGMAPAAQAAEPVPSGAAVTEQHAAADGTTAVPSTEVTSQYGGPAPAGSVALDDVNAPNSARTAPEPVRAQTGANPPTVRTDAVETRSMAAVGTIPTTDLSMPHRRSATSSGLGKSPAAVLPITGQAAATTTDAGALRGLGTAGYEAPLWIHSSLAGGAAAVLGVLLWRQGRFRSLPAGEPPNAPTPQGVTPLRKAREPGLGYRQRQP
ncbi:MAG: hypothetical protein F4070_06655 [Acidimicrobiales bacterium]|nr:hypothetical protein [Acidimicrobiales bacterium]